MSGDGRTADPRSHEPEENVQATTVGLPRLQPLRSRPLSEEERATINALPARSALLVAHEGPNQGARFLLDDEAVTAGRHPNADIFLDDVTVSRKHAIFERTPHGFAVRDNNSLNGTYVNHDRVDYLELAPGMEVQIGKFRLTFYGGEQPTT